MIRAAIIPSRINSPTTSGDFQEADRCFAWVSGDSLLGLVLNSNSLPPEGHRIVRFYLEQL